MQIAHWEDKIVWLCAKCAILFTWYTISYVGLCVKIQSLRLKSYKTDEIVVINTLVQENLFLNLVIILMENNYRKWCTQSWQTTLVWESSTVPCLESIFLKTFRKLYFCLFLFNFNKTKNNFPIYQRKNKQNELLGKLLKA